MNEENQITENKEEKNVGFRTALYFNLPKIDDKLKEISEGVENLKLNSNFMTPTLTPRTSDPKTFEFYKNCISSDLLKRLEESSPIKCNTPGFNRKISEIFLLNCEKDETEITTNLLELKEKELKAQKDTINETPEINVDDNPLDFKNFTQNTKNFLPKNQIIEEGNYSPYRIENYLHKQSDEGEKPAININIKINKSESPKYQKQIKYADSKSSPIYNYYNDSSEYLSQFFDNKYNNMIEKNNNNDIVKLQKFGMFNYNNVNVNNANNEFNNNPKKEFKKFAQLDTLNQNNSGNLNQVQEFRRYQFDEKISENLSTSLRITNENQEHNTNLNPKSPSRNFPILNKLPLCHFESNIQNSLITQSLKSNLLESNKETDIEENEKNINKNLESNLNNLEGDRELLDQHNSDDEISSNNKLNENYYEEQFYIKQDDEFVDNECKFNKVNNIDKTNFLNPNQMQFNNVNVNANHFANRMQFQFSNAINDQNVMPNPYFKNDKMNNSFLNHPMMPNPTNFNGFNQYGENNIFLGSQNENFNGFSADGNNCINQMNNDSGVNNFFNGTQNPNFPNNFDFSNNEQMKNQFWQKNFGKKKNINQNNMKNAVNINNNMNYKNSDNNQYSSKFDPDEYIVEMFGKRGWICDSCNNFNYETRSKCNRCGILKIPKKITNKKNKFNMGNNMQNPLNSQINLNFENMQDNQNYNPSNMMQNINSNLENFPNMNNFTQSENLFSQNDGDSSHDPLNSSINSSDKKLKKPFKERLGDWVCIKCKNLNFSFRIICNRCQMQKNESDKMFEQYMSNLLNYVKFNEMMQSRILMNQPMNVMNNQGYINSNNINISNNFYNNDFNNPKFFPDNIISNNVPTRHNLQNMPLSNNNTNNQQNFYFDERNNNNLGMLSNNFNNMNIGKMNKNFTNLNVNNKFGGFDNKILNKNIKIYENSPHLVNDMNEEDNNYEEK